MDLKNPTDVYWFGFILLHTSNHHERGKKKLQITVTPHVTIHTLILYKLKHQTTVVS